MSDGAPDSMILVYWYDQRRLRKPSHATSHLRLKPLRQSANLIVAALGQKEAVKTLPDHRNLFQFRHIGLSLVTMHPERSHVHWRALSSPGRTCASGRRRISTNCSPRSSIRELVGRAPKPSKFELALFTVSFRETTAGSQAATPKECRLSAATIQ